MALRYRVPLPGPFYYSGRVGPGHWLPRSSSTGTGPMGFAVKWFIVYPSVAVFGAGPAIMLAPFYGLFWAVCRLLRNRRKCQPVVRCVHVRRRPALCPEMRPYGFVPARRECPTVGGGPFGSDRCVQAGVSASPGLASCPPSRDRMGRRTRPYAAHHPMFCVGGVTCLTQRPGVWRTSHPGGVDGRALAP